MRTALCRFITFLSARLRLIGLSVPAAAQKYNKYKDSYNYQKAMEAMGNGDISIGTVINLKKATFGGLELTNVRASVVGNDKAPLLLGQSVLNRLGKIEIDYDRSVLKITSKERK